MDRQKDGQKDRQTLFHRTLLSTTGGPKSENLKGVIDTKYGNFDNPVFLNMKWFDPQTWYQKQQEAGKITCFYEQFKEKLDHVNF